MEVAIILGAIIQVVTLIVFFVMARNVSKIKNTLIQINRIHNIACQEDENTGMNTEGLSEGLLVVELKTEKQMRLGKRLDNGKYECSMGGNYVGTFSDYELMEFDEWVKNVYKK